MPADVGAAQALEIDCGSVANQKPNERLRCCADVDPKTFLQLVEPEK